MYLGVYGPNGDHYWGVYNGPNEDHYWDVYNGPNGDHYLGVYNGPNGDHYWGMYNPVEITDDVHLLQCRDVTEQEFPLLTRYDEPNTQYYYIYIYKYCICETVDLQSILLDNHLHCCSVLYSMLLYCIVLCTVKVLIV